MNKNTEYNIAIFKDISEAIEVKARLESDTLWLSLKQLVQLFDRDKSVISKHLKNIYEEEELVRHSTVAKFATVQIESNKTVTRQIEYYNLDAIISVGYRVNSKRGVEFRKWANNVLRDHLIKGYTFNNHRLQSKTIDELKQTIDLLSDTLISRKSINQEGSAILSLIQDYTRTWHVLVKYDEDNLSLPQRSSAETFSISYEESVKAIESIKKELLAKDEASNLFGQEKACELKGILGSIYQTFDRNELYPSFEEKAAHLIYFIIKDHPFNDGNKRIACLLFLLLLRKNIYLSVNVPSPEGLTSLAILIAESNPNQKELIIKLITNLITKRDIH
ncbi:RhuM family protein, partial [Rickettsiaceae bacterium]|nr:RhuM family protein [Rickettsiaceae bacterium]